MTDCCCKTAGKVSAEFPSLTDCLVIEETIIVEFESKAGEMKCLKVLSPDSCIITEGMLTAELELRADAVNGCEIPSFSG